MTNLQTAAQIRDNFTKALNDALNLGLSPPTEQGFDYETFMALRKVASTYPKIYANLIYLAQLELQRQLVGAHAADQRALVDGLISQLTLERG